MGEFVVNAQGRAHCHLTCASDMSSLGLKGPYQPANTVSTNEY